MITFRNPPINILRFLYFVEWINEKSILFVISGNLGKLVQTCRILHTPIGNNDAVLLHS